MTPLDDWHEVPQTEWPDDEPPYCVACGGTGEAPDNGTNMGECGECSGSGVME